MNYSYPKGIDVTGDTLQDGVIDYSGELLPPIDETKLSETKGITGNQPVDWNCSGVAGDVTGFIARDTQCDTWFLCDCNGNVNGYFGYNDWVALDFDSVRSNTDNVAGTIACPIPSE